jgi:hypothetical protein
MGGHASVIDGFAGLYFQVVCHMFFNSVPDMMYFMIQWMNNAGTLEKLVHTERFCIENEPY